MATPCNLGTTETTQIWKKKRTHWKQTQSWVSCTQLELSNIINTIKVKSWKTVSNMSRQLTCQFSENWQFSSSRIDQTKLYSGIYPTFSNILNSNFQGEFMSVFHTQLCGLIFNYGPQKYFGKWLYLVGEFRNLSARFFDRLNPKIFIDNHVLYEVLVLSWKFEAKKFEKCPR